MGGYVRRYAGRACLCLNVGVYDSIYVSVCMHEFMHVGFAFRCVLLVTFPERVYCSFSSSSEFWAQGWRSALGGWGFEGFRGV